LRRRAPVRFLTSDGPVAWPTRHLTVRVPSALSTHDTELSIVAREAGAQPPGRRSHFAPAGATVRAAATRPPHRLDCRGSGPGRAAAGRREDRGLAHRRRAALASGRVPEVGLAAGRAPAPAGPERTPDERPVGVPGM